MATSTTTAVELVELPIQNNASGHNRFHNNAVVDESQTSSSDDVLEASRLADSVVPDGGYGWVVVGACAIITWWFVGMGYSWGVLQGALVEKGLSSPATLSYVGSLAIALISCLAILNARIIRAIGAQRTAILGIFLLGMSEIVSSFAVSSLAGLFVTSGVTLGLGMSLCFMAVSATPAQYFSKKRGLANGIVFAGGGFGGATTSFLLDAVIQRHGIAWAYRVLGLVTLATGLPAAWLVKERSPVKTASFIEWRLFRDLGFVIIFTAGAIATFPLLVPAFFIPLYSRSVGLSASTGAGLLAGFNLSSAAGRILCGFLCDRFGALNVLMFSLLINAVTMLAIWPASKTLAPLIVFVVINGAANGGFFSTMPTVVGNVFGSQRVSVAMAMIVTGWGGGYLMGSPIAGYLLDAYGGTGGGFEAYRPAITYAGCMGLGATALVAVARFRKNRAFFAKV
ncbi:major facilitator superfamily domain-containing protein [Trichoderma breve]|uniref:Major facilitator superfamily domain-containing protein n=1 Tax=Trichoderma breve TaxID=2034170 RepID=A0A9W9E4C7_9HYPO|nr:major facilitator superfamily domain-containing protein [Trichoderma breve]KAJ4856880.1 major facilitator superfamily domain-containing protein [Trichoderma breve]